MKLQQVRIQSQTANESQTFLAAFVYVETHDFTADVLLNTQREHFIPCMPSSNTMTTNTT